VYESGEEFGTLGTLPVITPDHVDLNLPSNKIDPTKIEHLNAEQKDALLKLLDEFADVFVEMLGLCSVKAEWLQSLSSRKTDSRCIKMMISFNDTLIKQLKSMYELLRVLTFT